jgi:lipid II:glycine glycyltransferase (peptidoglycan interpeptide bridge formation enzyme)/GNAT superfamily N-acetyltransferase
MRMTFPNYHGVLGRLGTPGTDAQGNTIVAHAARLGDEPVGLVISQVTQADPQSADLLSVYVAAAHRKTGIATRLIEGLEQDLARRGISQLTGVYMSGKPSIAALERVFAKRGFTAPEHRKVVARFTPEEPSRAPWYQKAKLPPESEIFSWADLTPEEDAALRQSHADNPWIPEDLEPWRVKQPIDELSSVGLRNRGEVVGWAINHRVTPDLVRFTTAYMRRDLARRGASFPLWVESLKRLQGTGVNCTFVTSAKFGNMMPFVLKRVKPFVGFCGETRGVSKALSSGQAPVDVRPPRALVVDGDYKDREAWNAFVAGHPTGHFFQTWEWGLLQDGLGGRPRRIAVLSEGRILGCVQMLQFEGASKPFTYVPRGPAADPNDDVVLEQLLGAVVHVSAKAGAKLLRVEPQWAFDQELAQRFEQSGFARARQFIMPARTVLVELHANHDDTWNQLRSNTRNRIRLARKRGVEIRVGGEGDVAAFVTLFHETAARHGRPLVSAETFSLAWEHFGARGAMRLYMASHEGTDLAGIMVFVCGGTATYLWGASSASEAARKLNPNQLLHWTAMEWAREQGCTTYDLFGIPDQDVETLEAEYSTRSGGMWNLYRFKRGFGGRVHRHLGTFDCAFRQAT